MDKVNIEKITLLEKFVRDHAVYTPNGRYLLQIHHRHLIFDFTLTKKGDTLKLRNNDALSMFRGEYRPNKKRYSGKLCLGVRGDEDRDAVDIRTFNELVGLMNSKPELFTSDQLSVEELKVFAKDLSLLFDLDD